MGLETLYSSGVVSRGGQAERMGATEMELVVGLEWELSA